VRAAVAHADAAFAVMRRDFQLATSYRMSFVTRIVGSFFSLTLFYYLSRLVRVDTFASPDAYYAFVVVGLVILQVLHSGLLTPPGGLRQELVTGTFERLVVSPFGAIGSVLAMLLFPLVYALVAGLVMLAFAAAVFDMPVEWSTAPLSVPAALLGALAFAPFGILIAASVMVMKQALAGTAFVLAAISLIGGVYFPVALLPGWIEWTSAVQPFTAAIDLLRHLLVGYSLSAPAWLEVAKLAGFTVLLLPLSTWALGGALRHSRRRGTVTEY
jgi:ABC-2 type transport system permease protein